MQWFTQMEDEFFTDEAVARLAEAAPTSEDERSATEAAASALAALDAAAIAERAADIATLVKHRDERVRARAVEALARLPADQLAPHAEALAGFLSDRRAQCDHQRGECLVIRRWALLEWMWWTDQSSVLQFRNQS